MSSSHSDTAFRSKRPQARDLSAPHLRALRKELLLVRADVERMELAQATVELRQAVTHFSWLKFLVPGFGGMRFGARSGPGSAKGGGMLNASNVGALLKQYPLISSIASLVLAKPLRSTIAAGAKPALKLGSVALVGWEAFRIWQQMKNDPKKAAAAGTVSGVNVE